MNYIIIKEKIHTIRGKQVMLDYDLASLYDVETRVLMQAVKRNVERFPEQFMFQLSEYEFKSLKSQIVISNKGRGGTRKLPYAFTEQGVAMLSGVLRSKTAINVSIQIMNAFVQMRHFLKENANVFSRLDHVEKKQIEYDYKFKILFDVLNNNELEKQGIFYDGQIFDAHKFVSDIIRTAKSKIILIDNYVDDSTLTLFTKCEKNVEVTIYSKNISKQLELDIKKFNEQYESIKIKKFTDAHDRFLIIDNKIIYHFGASLKDIGKKWFGFSKFEIDAITILERLNH